MYKTHTTVFFFFFFHFSFFIFHSSFIIHHFFSFPHSSCFISFTLVHFLVVGQIRRFGFFFLCIKKGEMKCTIALYDTYLLVCPSR